MALPNCSLSIFEPLRSIAYSSITSSYVGVGTSFVNPIRMFTLVNTSDASILVSFNGIDDQIVVPGEVARVFDICANKSDQAGYLEQGIGTRVYVKWETGTGISGKFYVEVMYASNTGG